MLIDSNLVFGLAVSIKLCGRDPMGSSVRGSEKGSVARDKTEEKAIPRGIKPFHGAKGFGTQSEGNCGNQKIDCKGEEAQLK